MNFSEYLTESKETEVYVFYNKAEDSFPVDGNNNPWVTTAVSIEQAFSRLYFRIRSEGDDRLKWIVVNNKGNYTVVPWETFEEKVPVADTEIKEPFPIKKRRDQQLDLFGDQ